MTGVSGVVWAALVAAVVSCALTPLARAISRRLGVLDVPTGRSMHAVPTPRSGGYAIVLGMAVAIVAFGALRDADLRTLALVAAALALLPAIDEVRELPRRLRFAVQVAGALTLLLVTGVGIEVLHLPLLPAIHLGALATPVALLWLVWLTNAYNFMDGANGLAATEAVVCGSAFAVLFLRQGDPAAAIVAAATAGGAAGFLPWNFPRASIFMGDVGSATLGLLFGALALRLAQTRSVMVAVLPLLPFLLDATVTLLMRAAKGERIFSPHRSHFYQRLALQGGSHALVTTLWGGLAAVSSVLAITYEALSEAGRVVGLLGALALHLALAVTVWVRGRKV